MIKILLIKIGSNLLLSIPSKIFLYYKMILTWTNYYK